MRIRSGAGGSGQRRVAMGGRDMDSDVAKARYALNSVLRRNRQEPLRRGEQERGRGQRVRRGMMIPNNHAKRNVIHEREKLLRSP